MVIPDTITSIGMEALNGCASLESVYIPNSVKTLGKKAFLRCPALNDVRMSNSVEALKEYTFGECTALAYIFVGNAVKEIDRDSFAYTSLQTMVLPKSLVRIGSDPLGGGKTLEKIPYMGEEFDWMLVDKRLDNNSVYPQNDAWLNAAVEYDYVLPE